MVIARRVRIFGNVQGVGFRAFARDVAQRVTVDGAAPTGEAAFRVLR